MDDINNTAKNEVQELLKDLVVSPISKDLDIKLGELSDSMSVLKEIPEKFGQVRGRICKLYDDLSNCLSQYSSDITSNTCCIYQIVKQIKQEIEHISQIKKDVTSTGDLCKGIENTISKLCDDVGHIEKHLSSLDKMAEEIIDEVNESVNSAKSTLAQKLVEVSDNYAQNCSVTIRMLNVLITLSILNVAGLIGVLIMYFLI